MAKEGRPLPFVGFVTVIRVLGKALELGQQGVELTPVVVIIRKFAVLSGSNMLEPGQ